MDKNTLKNNPYEVKVICEHIENYIFDIYKTRILKKSTYEEVRNSLNEIKSLFLTKDNFIFIFWGKDGSILFCEDEFEKIKAEVISDSFNYDNNYFIIQEEFNFESPTPINTINPLDVSEVSYSRIYFDRDNVVIKPESKEIFFKYKSQIKCKICSKILYDAKSCKKGSNICLNCICNNMTVEDDDDKIICPCCNGELGELSLEPSMILNLIFVVCEKKCGKDVTLFDYANHKLLCNNGEYVVTDTTKDNPDNNPKYNPNDISDSKIIDKKIKESNDFFEQASLIESHGDNAKAKDIYKQAIKVNPLYSPAYYSLGKIYKTEGKFPEAIFCLKKAVEIDSNFSKAYNLLGVIFRKQRNNENAEENYMKAIETNPGDSNAINNLGLLYFNQGKYNQSETIYKKALKFDDKNSDLHNNLASTFKALGLLHKSLKHFQLAVKYSPDESKFHNNLGGILKKLGKIEESLDEFQISIAINPNGSNAHNFIGLLMQKLGRYNEAEVHYKKAITIKPEVSEYHNNIGTLYKKLKKFEEAEKCYLEALRLDPNNSYVLFNLAILYGNQKMKEKSIECYLKVLEKNPTDCDAFFNLGTLYKYYGDNEMADINFKKAYANCRKGSKLYNKLKNK